MIISKIIINYNLSKFSKSVGLVSLHALTVIFLFALFLPSPHNVLAQSSNQPDFRLPLPAGKDWLLSVEIGTSTSTQNCSGGFGGRYYGGGYDCYHSGRSTYALDFVDRNLQDGDVTGVDILAAAAGTVITVARGPNNNTGFGNYVVIDHGYGYTSFYGHLQDNSIPSNIAVGMSVQRGDKVGLMGTTGNSTGIHIHFEVRYYGEGRLESAILDQLLIDGRRIIDYRVGTTNAPTYYRSTNIAACGNGTSENFRNPSTGGSPVHPNGTLIKAANDGTVYLIQNAQRRWVTSPEVLRSLYQNGGFDFKDVITVAADELYNYPLGDNIYTSLPVNGRGQPEGRLIRQQGQNEVSIVTNGGMRRPFPNADIFLNLGFQFCNVLEVSDYYSYPAGSNVDGISFGTGDSSGSDPCTSCKKKGDEVAVKTKSSSVPS